MSSLMGLRALGGGAGAEFVGMRGTTRSALGRMLSSLGGGTYRVLVLDHRATRVLSASLRMSDITQEGVALVESLEKSRQPFPELEAVYICEPSTESVSRILQDFESGKTPRYARAHIFFLEHCPDEVFERIRAAPVLTKRIATLTESNINYLAVEENVFHCDLGAGTVDLFNADKTGYKTCTDQLVDQVVTLCATLNEYPFVRYQVQNALCSKLAMDFQTKFNNFLNNNMGFWFRGMDGHGDLRLRATLVVLDRTEDMNAPFLHAFSYQSLVYDLLNVEDGVCRYYKGDIAKYNGQDDKVPEESEAGKVGSNAEVGVCLLNEDDPLWTEFRHLHVVKVIERLRTHLDRYMETSIGKLRGGKKEGVSLEEMNKAIQDLPDYQFMMDKHAQHLAITRVLMHKVKGHKLLQCASVEQVMTTGVDEDGKEVGQVQLTQSLMELVKDPDVRASDTLRLVALYVVTQRGIKEEDRRLILESCNPPLEASAQEALINLSYLGVQISSRGAKPAFSKQQLSEAKRAALNAEDHHGRYTPLVAQIVDQVCKGVLSQEAFPYVIEPPPMLASESMSSNTSSTVSGTLGAASSSLNFSSFAAAFSRNKSPVSGGNSGTSDKQPAAESGVVLSVRTKPGGPGPVINGAPPAGGGAAGGAAAAAGKAVTADGESVTPQSPGAANLSAVVKRSPKGSRVIIFIAGGVTAMELVALHKVMQENNRDVVIGSTHILTPKRFLHDLAFLDPGKAAKFHVQLQALLAAKREAVQRSVQREVEPAHDPAAAAADAVHVGSNKKKSPGFLSMCGCMQLPPEPPSASAPQPLPRQ